jgi:hypothetical protein
VSEQSASERQCTHSELWPLQVSVPQSGLPWNPEGNTVQTPSVLAPSVIEHAPQAPAHAVSQQRSSTQCRLAHAASTAQSSPFASPSENA